MNAHKIFEIFVAQFFIFHQQETAIHGSKTMHFYIQFKVYLISFNKSCYTQTNKNINKKKFNFISKFIMSFIKKKSKRAVKIDFFLFAAYIKNLNDIVN